MNTGALCVHEGPPIVRACAVCEARHALRDEIAEAGYAVQEVKTSRAILAALERARLIEALDARAREAETIAQAGTLLAGTLQPATLYPEILALLRATLPCDLASLLFLDQGWARIACSSGTSFPVGAPVVDLQGTVAAEILAHSGPSILISDLGSRYGWRDLPLWLGEPRLRSAIVICLRFNAAVEGILVLGARRARGLHGEQARLAEAIAPALAAAVAAIRSLPEQRAMALIDEQGEEPASGSSVVVHQGSEALFQALHLVSAVEAGTVAVTLQPVALRGIVHTLAERSATQALTVHLASSEHLDVCVLADLELSVRLLQEVIASVVQLAPQAPPLRVTSETAEGAALIRVHLPAQARLPTDPQHLFRRLGRVTAGTNGAALQDLGLGLYLARRLAHAQDGELELTCSDTDAGSFVLTLPRARL